MSTVGLIGGSVVVGEQVRILKYPFSVVDRFVLELPEGAAVLHVDAQDGQPMMWASVLVDAPMTERVFRVYGTGHLVEVEGGQWLRYVATFLMYDGGLVWHLFEERKTRDE